MTAYGQVWHSMLYSCTHMGTVGVKELVSPTRNVLQIDGGRRVLLQTGHWMYVLLLTNTWPA